MSDGEVRERIRLCLAPLPFEWEISPLLREDFHGVREGLDRWVRSGMHGAMDWYPESTGVRSDPWSEWPWIRSVLVVKFPMSIPPGPAARDRPTVAGYARGRDYHDLFGQQLRKASALLESEFPGVETRWFCDALPVAEVHLAETVGFGWRGRNSLLLDRRRGSAFHLGGIFLSLDGISRPSPSRDHCGTCTRCLDSCPTSAILPGRRIDAGSCLSHWTIEDRATEEGVASRSVRGEIFGCDICQQVCPWNRRNLLESPQPSGWPGDWEEWVERCLPRRGFQSTFKGTPLVRAGRRKMLKVLLRAVWNVDPRRAIPLLRATAFGEDDPRLREWARGMLSRAAEGGEPEG